ncbi:conserved hypothetical protein [uncultured Desulfatiglans sp.]|nr:conserved hypothetical protein [uncultured Desulfatiglans sp.]
METLPRRMVFSGWITAMQFHDKWAEEAGAGGSKGFRRRHDGFVKAEDRRSLKGFEKLEPPCGIEPQTSSLRVRCSTN